MNTTDQRERCKKLLKTFKNLWTLQINESGVKKLLKTFKNLWTPQINESGVKKLLKTFKNLWTPQINESSVPRKPVAYGKSSTSRWDIFFFEESPRKDLKVHVLPLLSDLSSKRSCFLTDLQVFQIAAEQLRGDRVQQRERGEQGGAEEERGGGPHLQVRQEEGEWRGSLSLWHLMTVMMLTILYPSAPRRRRMKR